MKIETKLTRKLALSGTSSQILCFVPIFHFPFPRARCPLPVARNPVAVLVASSLGCVLLTSNATSFISLFVAQKRRNYVSKRYRTHNKSTIEGRNRRPGESSTLREMTNLLQNVMGRLFKPSLDSVYESHRLTHV